MLLIPGEEAQGILGWCSGRRPKIRTSWPPLGRSSQPSPHIHTALFPPTSSSLAQIRNTQIHSFRMEIRKVQLLPLWKLSTDWRPVGPGGVVPVLPLRATRTCWRVSWSGALQEIRISFIWSAGKYRKYLFLVFGLLENARKDQKWFFCCIVLGSLRHYCHCHFASTPSAKRQMGRERKENKKCFSCSRGDHHPLFAPVVMSPTSSPRPRACCPSATHRPSHREQGSTEKCFSCTTPTPTCGTRAAESVLTGAPPCHWLTPLS